MAAWLKKKKKMIRLKHAMLYISNSVYLKSTNSLFYNVIIKKSAQSNMSQNKIWNWFSIQNFCQKRRFEKQRDLLENVGASNVARQGNSLTSS